jgi:hypothetical protein
VSDNTTREPTGKARSLLFCFFIGERRRLWVAAIFLALSAPLLVLSWVLEAPLFVHLLWSLMALPFLVVGGLLVLRTCRALWWRREAFASGVIISAEVYLRDAGEPAALYWRFSVKGREYRGWVEVPSKKSLGSLFSKDRVQILYVLKKPKKNTLWLE